MILASVWVVNLTSMNVFAWMASIIALGAIIAVVALVVNGIVRIYKIRLIHHERMAMVEKGMDPGPFDEGREEAPEDAAAAEQAAGAVGSTPQ